VYLLTRRYVDKVIVCDDGSTDMTPYLAEAMGADLIRHKKNMGKGAALKSLFERAIELNPDVIITLDSDGQHDPHEIPKLAQPILTGQADVVIGSRYVEGSWSDTPLYRRMGLKIVNAISHHVEGINVRDTQSGFRAYSKNALSALLQCDSIGFGIETEQLKVLEKEKLKLIEVPISIHYDGLEKTSNKNSVTHGMELVAVAIRLVVEERPLLYLGIPGILLVVLGMFTGLDVLFNFNATRYFSLPMALITLGSLFTGALFMITSLILYAVSRLRYRLGMKDTI
jgi:glycosyltransferase involved in cell wall biosynthesis